MVDQNAPGTTNDYTDTQSSLHRDSQLKKEKEHLSYEYSFCLRLTAFVGVLTGISQVAANMRKCWSTIKVWLD